MRVPWDRGGIRWYLIFFSLVVGKTSIPSILWGLPFLLAGVAMHLWAKGCLHQKQEVTTSGPYRFVRHPFYLGNVFVDFSIAVMSGSAILMCALVPWWLTVYIPVMRQEEAVMTDRFGDAYRAYASRVPRLLPLARPIPAASGFSWRNPNILKTEVPRVLRFLSYPFLFLLAYELRQADLVFPPGVTPLAVCSLLLFVLLNGAAWQVKQVARNLADSVQTGLDGG